MKRKRIAVIGAGLGGLSTAARLGAAGHHLTVFDSQSFPGGKAGSESIGGYRFDTGPSLVTMPRVFDQLFESTGERREEFLRFTPLDEICRYHFADGSTLSSFGDRGRFGAEIEANTDDSAADLNRFLDYSARIHRITAHVFLERSLHEPRTYLTRNGLASILSVGGIDAFRTMDQANRSFFTDPRTVQFFNRYATYNGSNPYRTPGTLNIIPHVEYEIGAAAADDGIYSIPQAIARLVEAKGGEIHLDTRVESISYDSRDRTVDGVVVNGEPIAFDAVVSNADVVSTYERLLGDTAAPLYRRYTRLEPSSSGLVFYFGVSRSYPALSLHNIFFSADYRREFDDIFERNRCPEDPTVYLNITSKVTPADAPDGCENWFVLVNAPYHTGQDWEAEAKRVRTRVIERISQALGEPVGPAISVESVMSPADIEAQTGSRFGSLYGISSNGRLAAFLRHPNRSKRYPGLYFCGGSAHPGGGMPLVILSGAITAGLMQRDIERGKW